MSDLSTKKPSYAPAYIIGVYPALCEVAWNHGYALALHGSLQRDLDLVAIPWVDSPKSSSELLHALCNEFDLEPNSEPTQRPHGRLSWSIPLWWGAYVDLSIMSTKQKEVEK